MLRDALGSVAAQSSVSTANPGSRSGTSLTPTWSLHDRAGSPIAQTTPTGALTDTASYSDFGVQQFATTGWNAATGYTGEKTDPTTGLNLYLSRAYDPFAGSWLTADTFRGTATDSQTQNRYAFVGNNPTTHQDVLGFASGGLFGSIISFVTTVVKKVVTVGKKVVAAAQSVFNATAQLIKGAAQSIASTVKDVVTTVGNAAKSVGKAVGKTASDAAKWIARHAAAVPWQDVLAVVVGIGVTLAIVAAVALVATCTVATLGMCGVIIATGVLAGGAGAAVTYGLQSGEKSVEGLNDSVSSGMLGGLIGAGIGGNVTKVGIEVTKDAVAAAAKKAAAAKAAKAATQLSDDIAKVTANSVHNPGANEIMLGKYMGGGPDGYKAQAGQDYSYFSIDNWNKVKKAQGLDDAGMFERYNVPFLRNGIDAGKPFKFSHDPVFDKYTLGDEYEYLTTHGYEYDKFEMIARPIQK